MRKYTGQFKLKMNTIRHVTRFFFLGGVSKYKVCHYLPVIFYKHIYITEAGNLYKTFLSFLKKAVH